MKALYKDVQQEIVLEGWGAGGGGELFNTLAMYTYDFFLKFNSFLKQFR